MEEAEEYCQNCKRSVAKANFLIHSAHCQRNIKICETCDEPVSVKDVDEHIAEMHVAASCEKCNRTMEKWKLEDHESTCPKRPVACSYCEINCSWDEIKDHEAYCGARTDQCSECRQYVMFKDKASHKFHCSKLKGQVTAQSVKGRDAIYCFGCKLFITSDFAIHKRLCSVPKEELLKQLTSKHTEQKSSGDISTVIKSFSKLSMSEDEQLARNLDAAANDSRELRRYSKNLYSSPKKLDGSSYPDCQAVKSPGDTLDNRKNKERFRETENSHSNPQHKPESKMNETRMCPTCKKSFVKYQYNSHVEFCRRLHSKCEMCHEVMLTSLLRKHTETCLKEHPFSESKGSCEDNSILVKNGMLQCPTCKDRMTIFEMKDHQAICRPRLEKCPKCQEEVLVSEFEAHQELCLIARSLPLMQRSAGRGRGAFIKPTKLGADNIPVSSPNPTFRKKFLVEKKQQDCLAVDSNDCQTTVKDKEAMNKLFSSKFSFRTDFVENVQSPEKEGILVNCPHCNTRFPVSEIDLHLMNCSARLEECMLCHKGVAVADLKKHQALCSTQSSSQSASHCEGDAHDQKSSFKLCYNCKASFSSSELRKHVIQCVKDKCGTCNQIMSLEQLMQHKKNCFAMLKECIACKKKVPSVELRTHQELCAKSCSKSVEPSERNALDLKMSLVTCYKCRASFPRSEMSAHVAYCVENKCSTCQQKVPDAQFQEHKEFCPARLKLSAKLAECIVCEKLVPSKDLKSHQELCATSRNQSVVQYSERSAADEKNTVITCQRCLAEFPFSKIHEHVALCEEDECGICGEMVPLGQLQQHKENCSKYRFFTKENNGGGGGKLSVGDRRITCPTCQNKVHALDINEHVQKFCSRMCDICEKTVSVSAFEHHRKSCRYPEQWRLEKERNERSSNQSNIKDNFKNCPMCAQTILSKDLAAHVSQCVEGKTLCSVCGILVSNDVYDRHSRDCSIPSEENVVEVPPLNYAQVASIPPMSKKQKRKFQNEAWKLENNDREYPALEPRRSTPTSIYADSTQVVLPCEFCNELFPEYKLIQHQSACRPDLLHFALPRGQNDEEEKYFSASESFEENKKMKPQETEAEGDVKPGEYLRTLKQGIREESHGYPFADVVNPHSDSSDEDKTKTKFNFKKTYDMDPNKASSFPTKDLTSKNVGKYSNNLSFDNDNDLSVKKSSEDGKVQKKMAVNTTVKHKSKKSQKRGGKKKKR